MQGQGKTPDCEGAPPYRGAPPVVPLLVRELTTQTAALPPYTLPRSVYLSSREYAEEWLLAFRDDDTSTGTRKGFTKAASEQGIRIAMCQRLRAKRAAQLQVLPQQQLQQSRRRLHAGWCRFMSAVHSKICPLQGARRLFDCPCILFSPQITVHTHGNITYTWRRLPRAQNSLLPVLVGVTFLTCGRPL